MLIAFIGVLHQRGGGQHGGLGQVVGQRGLQRIRELHEAQQHLRRVAGHLEQFAQVAQALDAWSQVLRQFRREVRHLQTGKGGAHGVSPR
ncbi:hypothetical protein D3C85_1696900 [compost metagenome]